MVLFMAILVKAEGYSITCNNDKNLGVCSVRNFVNKEINKEINETNVKNEKFETKNVNAFHSLEIICEKSSGNELNHLPLKIGTNFPSLNTIQISKCKQLKSILTNKVFQETSLKVLEITQTSLVNITEVAFEDLGKLVYLNLSSNKISTLHENTLRKLIKLILLDLSFNNIKSLPANLLNNDLAHLEFVLLNDNCIEISNFEVFNDLGQLKTVNLDANPCTHSNETNKKFNVTNENCYTPPASCHLVRPKNDSNQNLSLGSIGSNFKKLACDNCLSASIALAIFCVLLIIDVFGCVTLMCMRKKEKSTVVNEFEYFNTVERSNHKEKH